MKLKFGLGFGQDQNVHNVADYAREAERLGYEHITVADINNLANECHVIMTLIAAATEKIHVGHGVTNPATYHPGALANAMASIRELSDDRAFVGIGAGGPYGQLLKKGVLMKDLRRAIKFISDYSAGLEGELADGAWHSEWIRNSKWNGKRLPVWVAVAGPRTCEITGEVGDAVLSIGMDPVLQQWRKDQVQRGAEKSGRSVDDIAFYIRTQIYIAESKQAAKRELEPYAATCTYELHQILRRDNEPTEDLRHRIETHHPGLLEQFKTIFDNYDPYWTERIGGPQTKYVTQEVIDFFLATGTPADIVAQLKALEPVGIAGVSSVLFSIEQDFDMMERISSQIMPHFQ
jgi:5,10-methylenetetrahydromethanopterin reductase